MTDYGMPDMSEIENKLYWTKGHEAGVQLERNRIIRLIKRFAATRDILETLKYPFLAEEIEDAILDGQNAD
jgi:hypothetical protein